jgi:hypothetical protein
MGILPIEPLPKHQIMVLTHKAIKVKMREQLGRVEKKTPTSHLLNRWVLEEIVA